MAPLLIAAEEEDADAPYDADARVLQHSCSAAPIIRQRRRTALDIRQRRGARDSTVCLKSHPRRAATRCNSPRAICAICCKSTAQSSAAPLNQWPSARLPRPFAPFGADVGGYGGSPRSSRMPDRHLLPQRRKPKVISKDAQRLQRDCELPETCSPVARVRTARHTGNCGGELRT
jgi:hypothetical protein